MKSRLFAAVLFLLVAASAFAAPPREISVQNVIAAMNEQRAQHGLPPLREESRLMDAASDRMRDMEELGYWAHRAPDGRSPFVWLPVRGYDHAYAGENLANGFETAGILVEAWMESEGHRRNILSPLYNECGVAIIDGSTTGRAVGKSVVVLFARQKIEPQTASR